ncbi:MAG: hypothetical protein M3401_16910 [Actinomycetota bacterium]|nr:hypothetical protein [Actinomycetota bacterium]
MTFDDLVRQAGDRLAAGAMTRRTLIGEAALGGVGIALIGCGGSKDDAAAKVPDGVPRVCGLSRGRIHVCYEPWRVVRSEPAELLPVGYEGVAVRKGPEPDAPIIYKNGDPCVIRIGGVFGRQSARQSDKHGGVKNDCPAPPMRPGRGAGKGFLWGYPGPRQDSGTWNKGGWIAQSVAGIEYTERYFDYQRAICGPADLDFDCRAGDNPTSRFKTQCRKIAYPDDPGFRCNGGKTRLGTCRDPRVYEVGVQKNIDDHPLLHDLSHERYNLKFQADSTTIFWLVPGDIVRRHCYKCTLHNPSRDCPKETADPNSTGCCRAYSCVTVVKAQYCPAGVTGWINSSVLRSRERAKQEIDDALRVTGGDFNGY